MDLCFSYASIFFIAGLFIQKSVQKPLDIFLLSRVKIIIYPYFIWSILQGGLQTVLSKYTNNKIQVEALWKITYQPIMQFWFLYVLLILVLSYAILYQFTREKTPFYFFLISLFCWLLFLWNIDIGSWGVLYQARSNVIYFSVGAILGSSPNYLKSISSSRSKILIIISFLGFAVIAFATLKNLQANNLIAFLLAFLGIGSTMCLSIFSARSNQFKFIQTWGIFSLAIFVAHTIASGIARIILQKLLGITEPWIHLLIGTGVGIYLSIALVLLGERLKFPYFFTYGKSFKV